MQALFSTHLIWQNEADTAAFARRLAWPALRAGACIHLEGPLGAGKTSFVRHVLRALGVSGPVQSPTYGLVQVYDVDGTGLGPQQVHHFDLYRFHHPSEWEEAGLDEALQSPGLKLLEWPSKAAGYLPLPDVVLCIQPQAHASEYTRVVEVKVYTAVGRGLLQ